MKVCPGDFVTVELAAEKAAEVVARYAGEKMGEAAASDFRTAVRRQLEEHPEGQPVVLLAVELRDVEDAVREREGAPLGPAAERAARAAFLKDWEGAIEFSSIPEALGTVVHERVMAEMEEA